MKIQKEIDIAPLLWLKIGGKAKYLLTCENYNDVLEALEFVQQKSIDNFLTIGYGSNLIFTKDYFDGAIIRIIGTGKEFVKNDNNITSFSGETLDDLIISSFDNNLTGLEWAGGLPGTVGAGVRGNVGAFGGEIKDTFVSAEVAAFKNKKVSVSTLSKEDMKFSYRESKIKNEKNTIVLSAKFGLKKANNQEITKAKEIYKRNKKYRQDRHPINYPNCGSVFKNIVKKEEVDKIFSASPEIKEKALSDWYGKVSMGFLINKLGFTGKSVGGAQVSPKHSNFIINKGNAKGSDVITLIDEIKKAVEDKYGITPEVEPEIID